MITISRDCFAEPEIHEKLKKMPSGRKKLITKRIPVSVDYPHVNSKIKITKKVGIIITSSGNEKLT